MLVRANVYDSTGSFARSAQLKKARGFYSALTHGADFDLEDVLAHVAEGAIDADRRSELADVCRREDSPRWCADALERP